MVISLLLGTNIVIYEKKHLPGPFSLLAAHGFVTCMVSWDTKMTRMVKITTYLTISYLNLTFYVQYVFRLIIKLHKTGNSGRFLSHIYRMLDCVIILTFW